ncbi:DNA methyltransferase [Lentzea kentuckyensis]|uniref:DNA methyltransferase n=1 Tax=Lentzea kentuckyensis TaxID=360086 RepID=UPI000A3D115A|nr:DNA methyltransferase [Lentzea kentuckyensis]
MNDSATSVWLTGQRGPRAQLREAGCVLGTEFDSERVPPATAAHAIAAYTRPGDLVLDPNCGAGTVLTEALRAGRHALGLTARKQWWTLARANVTATKAAGAWCDGSVLEARPKMLATIRAAGLIGRVGLVLMSLRTGPDSARAESAIGELARTMRYCEPLLRPGGYVVIVARPRRSPDGALIDLTTPLIGAGSNAGLVPVERCIALTADVRGDRVATRTSAAERRAVSRARGAGLLRAVNAHDEVLAFQLAHDAELAVAGAVDWRLASEEAARTAVSGVECSGRARAA